MRVIVVGAGICGLGTAVALNRVGIDCVVLEKAPQLSAEGAAITVWNNGLQALARLKLRVGYLSIFEPIEVLRLLTSNGRRIGDIPVLRLANAFGPGAAMVYRPELTALLAQHLRPEQLQFNAELAAIESSGTGVTAVLTDGRRIHGDILAGADGMRATTKQLLAPAEMSYCGHVAWRGTACFAHPMFPDGESFSVIGKGSYFVAHHLTGDRFYWIGTRATAQPERLERSHWKSAAQEHFSEWLQPVRDLIDATAESAVLVNDIFSCTRPDYSVQSNALLLGDAAHASAPQLGQGAGLALEDAVLFADCLRREGWPAGGHSFARLRQERAALVVNRSQAIADIYHQQSPLGVWLRNATLRATPRMMRLKRAGWASRVSLPNLTPG